MKKLLCGSGGPGPGDFKVMSEEEIITPINEKLTLIQRAAGLTFGTDAYLLAAFVRGVPRGKAVELGGGTGVVSLLCAARDRFAHIDCAEIQPEYAEQRHHDIPCPQNDIQRPVIRPGQIAENYDSHAEQDLEDTAGQDGLRLVKIQHRAAQQIEHRNILLEN